MSKIQKLLSILRECYVKVYSYIGVDFNKLEKDGDILIEGWYNKYYLEGYIQSSIVDEILKKHNLTSSETKKIHKLIKYGGFPKQVNDEEI